MITKILILLGEGVSEVSRLIFTIMLILETQNNLLSLNLFQQDISCLILDHGFHHKGKC
jgi:hypothetical protein